MAPTCRKFALGSGQADSSADGGRGIEQPATRLLDQDEPIAGQELQRWTGEEVSIRDFLDQYEVDAGGHRVVHSDTKIVEPTVVEDEVRRYLASMLHHCTSRGHWTAFKSLPKQR